MIDNKLVEYKLNVLSAELKITLEILAKKKLNITYASLRNKLTGKTKWYYEEVWQLSQILDCEVDELHIRRKLNEK